MANDVNTPGAGNPASVADDRGRDHAKTKEEIQAALAGVNTLQFRADRATMPTQLYIRPEDQITVTTNNLNAGLKLVMLVRYLRMDGAIIPMEFNIPVPTSDGTTNSTTIQIDEGFLLGLSVTPTAQGNQLQPGMCFCSVTLTRAGISSTEPSQLLAANWILNVPSVSWPVSQIITPLTEPGFMQDILGATPAAGAEIVETVPARTIWKLRSIQATLSGSVAVASRIPNLILSDGANVFSLMPSPQNIQASQNIQITWTPGIAGFAILGANRFFAIGNLPPDLFLRPGWKIQTQTDAIQAADQWTAPRYAVETWVAP